MNELITKVFDSKLFNKIIDEEYAVIKPYVALDFSAFYTSTQVENAVTKLKEFCETRVQSIHKQINGTLATKTIEQNSEDRIVSTIDLNDLGFIADDNLKHVTENTESTNSKKSHNKSDNNKKE